MDMAAICVLEAQAKKIPNCLRGLSQNGTVDKGECLPAFGIPRCEKGESTRNPAMTEKKLSAGFQVPSPFCCVSMLAN